MHIYMYIRVYIYIYIYIDMTMVFYYTMWYIHLSLYVYTYIYIYNVQSQDFIVRREVQRDVPSNRCRNSTSALVLLELNVGRIQRRTYLIVGIQQWCSPTMKHTYVVVGIQRRCLICLRGDFPTRDLLLLCTRDRCPRCTSRVFAPRTRPGENKPQTAKAAANTPE